MAAISFKTKLFKINDWTILHLPQAVSAKLPSRGQTMVKGTINGFDFAMPLEPDGRGSHWLHVDDSLLKSAKVKAGDTVTLKLESSKDWPEPNVPNDLIKVLKSHPGLIDFWHQITPLARWEWIRWIRSTGKDETRKKRLEVACDKMKKGERRPCCWNRNLSTEPHVSKNGILLDPTIS